LSTPNIIVAFDSEQQQQHCLSVLAGQIKHSYLRKRLVEIFYILKSATQIEYSGS
jgi:hypothetical protein